MFLNIYLSIEEDVSPSCVLTHYLPSGLKIRNKWLVSIHILNRFLIIWIQFWISVFESTAYLNSQNCTMFPLAFVAGSLQSYWWGFISRNYVVWPIFFNYECFIALKGTHFLLSPYRLDKYISSFSGVWVYFFILILFQIEIPVNKVCGPGSDTAFCGVWSWSAPFAKVLKMWH